MLTYLDKHLNREHAREDIVGAGEEGPFLRVRRDVGSLHRQSDAVQCDE